MPENDQSDAPAPLEGDERKEGPLGDVLPSERQPARDTPGGQPPEKVEDRPTVGTVKPEDYPEQQ